MNCLYTYCTVKETVDESPWRQISYEWWWLEAIFSIFPYSHMINCAAVSLILAQTVKSQCSPVYPPPAFWWAWCLCTHMHTVPEASRKLGSETEIILFSLWLLPWREVSLSYHKDLIWFSWYNTQIDDTLVTNARAVSSFLNEMHVRMVIQMFPSNRIDLTVGATVLRQLQGSQSPTYSTTVFPCMPLLQSHEALPFFGPAGFSSGSIFTDKSWTNMH